MSCKYCDLRKKDVVNICDGKILGCIIDLIICIPEGCIEAIVVPGCARSFNVLRPRQDIVIPWCQIIKIGDDVILVELEKPKFPKK